MNEEDNRLVMESKGGNEESFSVLLSKYRSYVISFLKSKFISSDDMEDAYQIACIKAWRKIGGFETKCQFSTWLCKIAYNAYIDQMKSRRRAMTFSIDSGEEERNGRVDSILSKSIDYDKKIMTPFQEVSERERVVLRNEFVNRIFDALDDKHRHVAKLVILDGHSYEKASKEIGVPIGTIMSRIFYAKRKLAKEYDRLSVEKELRY